MWEVLGDVIRWVRSAVAGGIRRFRDRRRRLRKRLEEIFDRKTFTSVGVLGSAGKLIERSVVPVLDPHATLDYGRAGAWAIVFIVSVVIAVHWDRLARMTEEAADAVEEAADTD